MKINESKHGFVVKKRTEVSELNAIMYEMEHIKTHLKPYQVMIVGFFIF